MSDLKIYTSVRRHQVTSRFLATIYGRFQELGFTNILDLFCAMNQLVIVCGMCLVAANLL